VSTGVTHLGEIQGSLKTAKKRSKEIPVFPARTLPKGREKKKTKKTINEQNKEARKNNKPGGNAQKHNAKAGGGRLSEGKGLKLSC